MLAKTVCFLDPLPKSLLTYYQHLVSLCHVATIAAVPFPPDITSSVPEPTGSPFFGSGKGNFQPNRTTSSGDRKPDVTGGQVFSTNVAMTSNFNQDGVGDGSDVSVSVRQFSVEDRDQLISPTATYSMMVPVTQAKAGLRNMNGFPLLTCMHPPPSVGTGFKRYLGSRTIRKSCSSPAGSIMSPTTTDTRSVLFTTLSNQ